MMKLSNKIHTKNNNINRNKSSKISFSIYPSIAVALLRDFVVFFSVFFLFTETIAENSIKKLETNNNSTNNSNYENSKDNEEPSLWDSNPIEIDAVNVQILDKISGKVLKKRIKVNEPLRVAGIEITLKRCFKNPPEDSKEIYAFVEISENKSIFSRWLFASSPSVNLFTHPQYDFRVEF